MATTDTPVLKPISKCDYCGKVLLSHQKHYCSSSCYHTFTRLNGIKWNRDVLIDLYITKHMSTGQIAEALGVAEKSRCESIRTAREAVREALKRLNIPLRTHKEAIAIRSSQYPYSRNNARGPESHKWNGGRRVAFGYILVLCPGHKRADINGYVREHILVWEKAHGKDLPDGYVVHHLNGIKSDNRPENLVALPNKKHRHVLAAKGKRIASLEQRVIQLEAEVTLLRMAVETGQLLLKLGDSHV